MSDIDHDGSDSDDVYEIDELLGAYALDAVDHDDRRRVEDYLRINPRAASEVQEHREVATMLAFTGMDAPAGVWAKIAAEIDADAPAPGPELAKMFAVGSSPGIASDALREDVDQRSAGGSVVIPIRRARSTWLLGVAAAITLAVAGFAVLVPGSSTSEDPIDAAYAAAVIADDSLSARLVSSGSAATATGVIDADGHGYVDGAGLPRLASDMTYQLWGVLSDTGDVVSIGILGGEPALETFTADGKVTALAVTVEQAPGVVSDGNPEGAYTGVLG